MTDIECIRSPPSIKVTSIGGRVVFVISLCKFSNFLSSLLLSVLMPDPSDCEIDRGNSVIRKLKVCLRLKFIFFEIITSMRIKPSLRLSAINFFLDLDYFIFKFSFAKLYTFLLLIGFKNL